VGNGSGSLLISPPTSSRIQVTSSSGSYQVPRAGSVIEEWAGNQCYFYPSSYPSSFFEYLIMIGGTYQGKRID
jgi:hypothetical protein